MDLYSTQMYSTAVDIAAKSSLAIDLFTRPWGECVEGGVPTIRCIWVVLSNLINAAIVLAAVAALYFLIISGIRYITSRGDPEALDNARRTATFAIIGLVFVLFSFFIFNFVLESIGANPDDFVNTQPDQGSGGGGGG